MNFIPQLFKTMLNPRTILVSVIIGILIGIYAKNLAAYLAPAGKMYLAFLQMCVIPVLVSAVTSSLANLIRSHGITKSLFQMVLVFSMGLFLISALGIGAGLIGRPGAGLDPQTRAKLGEIVKVSEFAPDLEVSLSGAIEENNEPKFQDFFLNLIPKNIFESLVEAKMLSLIFFSIIFGIAMGFTPPHTSAALFNLMESTYRTFQWLIHKAMYILPLGLACLLADQISRLGMGVLIAMTKLILVFYVIGIIVLGLNTLFIWRRSKQSFYSSVRSLLDPIIVAVGTLSSLATIPSAITALHNRLKFSSDAVNLYLPLGIVLCRYGNVLYFAVATIFIAQLYDSPLNFVGLIIVLMGAVLAGMATSGATGILTLSMLSIILTPLGLPLEAALVLFIAIDPIIDPLRTLLIVHCNITATTAIAPLETKIETATGPLEAKIEIATSSLDCLESK